MSREIKFRAWDKENKVLMHLDEPETKWEFTDNGLTVSYLNEIHYEGGGEIHTKHEWEVLDCELMQYTGLKDKNGKEIYEGDIMELVNADDQMNAGHMEGIGCVVWDDYDLSWKCKIGDYMIPINWGGHKSKEVIGNIHEPTLQLTKS